MTPEALSAYLLKHFTQDAVQDVMVTYLSWTGPPIRYPKRWGWRQAYWRTMDQYRKTTIRGQRVDFPKHLSSPAPDPLTIAHQHQCLERYDLEMRTGKRKWDRRYQRWNTASRGVTDKTIH